MMMAPSDSQRDRQKVGNSLLEQPAWPKESELVFEEVPCPICEGKDHHLIWKERAEKTWFRSGINKEVGVVKCNLCGFIFTNPRPTLETRMLFYSPKTNPDLVKRKATCGYDLRQQLRWLILYYDIVKTLGDFRKRGRVLEIGVAGGLFLLAASDAINSPTDPLDFELQGLAADKEEAEQARMVTGFDIFHTKVEDWKTANKYDIIVAINVLEHIPNLREFVGAIYRLLNESGMFVFLVPNNYIVDKLLPVRRREALDPDRGALMVCEHINHFTAMSMQKLLISQNFRKIEFRPILDLRTRYWERRYHFKQSLLIYADYFISKITRRSPMIGSLFGIAFK